MKILMLTHRFAPAIGGVETHVFEIAKNLVKNGHQVTVFTSNLESLGSKKRFTKEFKHHFIDGIEIYRFNAYLVMPKIDAATLIPKMLTKTLALAKNYDIIHAHSYGYFTSICAALVAISSKTPVILTPHFASETVVNKTIRKVYDSFPGWFSLKFVDKIIALTAIEKKELGKIGALKNKKFEIVPNGVNLERFKIKYSSKELRKRYGIKKDDKIVLSVCRLAPNKGLRYLIKAIPDILKSFPNTKFVMIGKDWGEKNILTNMAESGGYLNQVIFPGKLSQKEMDSFYLESDVFILPSIGGEAFGIVLLEAMAAGKPVIASDIGGVPCVVNNGKNGFLVPPKNPQILSSKIKLLFRDKKLYQKFSETNLKKIRNYSWNNITKDIEKVYKKLL